MKDAEELYSKMVSRLSPNERLRLVSLILDGLTQEKEEADRSVLDLLDDLPPSGRLVRTSAETDAYLREERDSWDRGVFPRPQSVATFPDDADTTFKKPHPAS